jgi:hypothetical protein
MQQDLDFLCKFPRNEKDRYMLYDSFTFDNFFRLLLKAGFDHENSFHFMIAHCSLSAVVFQERILNEEYRNLSSNDAYSFLI